METILTISTVLTVVLLIIIIFMMIKVKVLKTTIKQLDLKRRKNAIALQSNKAFIESQGKQIKELQEALSVEKNNNSILRDLLHRSNKRIAKGVIAVNEQGYEIGAYNSIKQASVKLDVSRSAIKRSAEFYKQTKKGKYIKGKNYYLKYKK